jgi:L-fuconolactonase
MTGPEVIDTHVHVGLDKYGPIEPYLADMATLGLRCAVLVQHIGNDDDTYLAATAAAHPGRFAVIGSVDPLDAGVARSLPARVRALGLAGIRLPGDARSPGRDPLAVWRAADSLGLVVSVRGPFEALIDPAFKRIVTALPNIRFRFEHLGWFKPHRQPMASSRFDRFLRLAVHPNTFVMWSGFYANSGSAYPYATSRPIVAAALAAFGAERTMWSGDWNRPDGTIEQYRAEMELVGESFPVDAAQRAWIMGGTAARLFGFDPQPIDKPTR